MTNITLTYEQLKEATEVWGQIKELQARLTSLLGGVPVVESPARPAGKRNLSPKARKAIGDAQRARWAKLHAEKTAAPAAPVVPAPTVAAA